jgi:hypothetical protein
VCVRCVLVFGVWACAGGSSCPSLQDIVAGCVIAGFLSFYFAECAFRAYALWCGVRAYGLLPLVACSICWVYVVRCGGRASHWVIEAMCGTLLGSVLSVGCAAYSYGVSCVIFPIVVCVLGMWESFSYVRECFPY